MGNLTDSGMVRAATWMCIACALVTACLVGWLEYRVRGGRLDAPARDVESVPHDGQGGAVPVLHRPEDCPASFRLLSPSIAAPSDSDALVCYGLTVGAATFSGSTGMTGL